MESGSRDALIIKLYSLEGSRLVYDLDDNTLTMSELVKQLDELKSRIENEALGLTDDDYRPELLERLS